MDILKTSRKFLKSLSPVGTSNSATGGMGVTGNQWKNLFVDDPYTGAWERNDELSRKQPAHFYALFACVRLISSDIAKLPVTLRKMVNGVITTQPTPIKWRKLFKRPNSYQNWQQFSEQWSHSLLLRGNAFIFKERDVYGKIVALKVLNPDAVKVLVSDDGQVFYELYDDLLAGIRRSAIPVPASEIIHDRINAFYHPLVGLSPVYACAASTRHGEAIIRDAEDFFKNGSKPSGVLEVDAPMSEENAQKMKRLWNLNYTGSNAGQTAVLTGGVKYRPITMSAMDSRLIEQLKMSASVVAAAFGVPPFKIGLEVGTGKIEEQTAIYYADCLQALIESRENLLDEVVDFEDDLEVYLDISVLLRMDSISKMQYLRDGVGAGILAPNEARSELGYQPVDGGNSPMLQQQNFSLEAISRRDSSENPFGKTSQTQAEKSFDTLYKGVFKADVSYSRGEFVTHKGSMWHCEKSCKGEFSHENFKLCSKKG